MIRPCGVSSKRGGGHHALSRDRCSMSSTQGEEVQAFFEGRNHSDARISLWFEESIYPKIVSQ